MVIRNAKRRMLGLSVGLPDDAVEPDRVAIGVIEDFQTMINKEKSSKRAGAELPVAFGTKRTKII